MSVCDRLQWVLYYEWMSVYPYSHRLVWKHREEKLSWSIKQVYMIPLPLTCQALDWHVRDSGIIAHNERFIPVIHVKIWEFDISYFFQFIWSSYHLSFKFRGAGFTNILFTKRLHFLNKNKIQDNMYKWTYNGNICPLQNFQKISRNVSSALHSSWYLKQVQTFDHTIICYPSRQSWTMNTHFILIKYLENRALT